MKKTYEPLAPNRLGWYFALALLSAGFLFYFGFTSYAAPKPASIPLDDDMEQESLARAPEHITNDRKLYSQVKEISVPKSKLSFDKELFRLSELEKRYIQQELAMESKLHRVSKRVERQSYRPSKFSKKRH